MGNDAFPMRFNNVPVKHCAPGLRFITHSIFRDLLDWPVDIGCSTFFTTHREDFVRRNNGISIIEREFATCSLSANEICSSCKLTDNSLI